MTFQISIEHLSKSYNDGTLQVWGDLNLVLESGQAYCLMGASGSGKTTLLRILLGLESADAGDVQIVELPTDSTRRTQPADLTQSIGQPQLTSQIRPTIHQSYTHAVLPLRLTAVFQENRLCESFTPIDNILLVTGKLYTRESIRAELSRLLPEESLNRPVSTLSGGMKRRVAIARALLAPSDGILMDEPFTGLDEDTKETVIRYIKEKAADKLLLISTHQEEDVELLGARLLRLP